VTDYWLSKLCFDLQDRDKAAAYRADRERMLADYRIQPELLEALRADDVARLAPHVNAYLLRYYFTAIGMADETFIARLGPYHG
jgi:hypothetical protein